jgi:hypothetical protein
MQRSIGVKKRIHFEKLREEHRLRVFENRMLRRIWTEER